MKPRLRLSGSGKSNPSLNIATFAAFGALMFVLVLFLFGAGPQHGLPLKRDFPYCGALPDPESKVFFIRHTDGQRWIFEKSDESDIASYFIQDFQKKILMLNDKKDAWVYLLIDDSTKAGEFVKTIDELRENGINHFTISCE